MKPLRDWLEWLAALSPALTICGLVAVVVSRCLGYDVPFFEVHT